MHGPLGTPVSPRWASPERRHGARTPSRPSTVETAPEPEEAEPAEEEDSVPRFDSLPEEVIRDLAEATKIKNLTKLFRI